MRTTTLRLGTGVIVLPWHNPVLLAEQAATLDQISRGRLDFGVGRGYRHNEFAGFRIPMEEAEPRFEESMEVMTRAFVSRQRFSHRGRFWQFDDIVVEPPPSQRPHPPFWVAAGSENSIRRAAKRGFNLILDQYASPELLGQRIAMYRSELEAAGGRFDPMRVAVARQAYVASDPADKAAAMKKQEDSNARTIAAARSPDGKVGSHILSYAATPGGTLANTLIGTREEICESLTALSKAGVAYVLLTILGGKPQLQRFAREIMPAFPVKPEPRDATAARQIAPA
jgi:alkanesulfonate monooxygenase SsuD/methylene tetrahydromethanopterin reductase-like flavin-dependent oxidoreductase (luciferase family)